MFPLTISSPIHFYVTCYYPCNNVFLLPIRANDADFIGGETDVI